MRWGTVFLLLLLAGVAWAGDAHTFDPDDNLTITITPSSQWQFKYPECPEGYGEVEVKIPDSWANPGGGLAFAGSYHFQCGKVVKPVTETNNELHGYEFGNQTKAERKAE